MRAVVTGGAMGIGAAIVRRLAADSLARGDRQTNILIADVAETQARALARELTSDGARVDVMSVDIASVEAPTTLAAYAGEHFGGVDVVVSNVGFSARKPLEQLEVADWDRVFAANVRAAWLLAKSFYGQLHASGGTFIAIGSIAGIEPQEGLGPYSPSKAALISLVQQLAVEWGPRGIRANCVSPGPVATDKTKAFYEDEVINKARCDAVPLRRIGRPEDIAAAVSFLASDNAAFCNGLNLVVDGGLMRTPVSTSMALPPILFRPGSNPA